MMVLPHPAQNNGGGMRLNSPRANNVNSGGKYGANSSGKSGGKFKLKSNGYQKKDRRKKTR